ncbi:MAG: 2TM domain-containing protein [Alphaproteobacteria bacterium]|nr:2TM domain-containing protein [Alphaproteobacteria bacterium]
MRDTQDNEKTAHALLLGFGRHLASYFAVVLALAVVNLTTAPENPWFMWPMVGYGGVLAVHAAYVMGLSDVFMRRSEAPPSRNG